MAADGNAFDRDAFRAGRGWGVVLGMVAVAAVAGLILLMLGNKSDREGIDAVGPGGGTVPAATSGTIEGASRGVPGSPLAVLFRDGGSAAALEGQRVELDVPADRLGNVTFWVGSPPGSLLAVLDRDARTAVERQRSVPSSRDLQAPDSGVVRVRGVVERVPYPEATYSWQLTRPNVERLLDSGVYLRVDAVEVAQDPQAETPAPDAP
jgi:hypothetical protein